MTMSLAVNDLLSMPVRQGSADSRKTGHGFMLGMQVFFVLACAGYICFELALAIGSMEEDESFTTTGGIVVSTLEEPVDLRAPVRLDADSTVKSIGDDLRLGNSETKTQQEKKGPCGEAVPSNAATKAMVVFLAGILANCRWARSVIAAGAL